jgi:hypothetical protein
VAATYTLDLGAFGAGAGAGERRADDALCVRRGAGGEQQGALWLSPDGRAGSVRRRRGRRDRWRGYMPYGEACDNVSATSVWICWRTKGLLLVYLRLDTIHRHWQIHGTDSWVDDYTRPLSRLGL